LRLALSGQSQNIMLKLEDISKKLVRDVPANKALFFPILNALFGAAVGGCGPTNPGVACNLLDLRVATAATMDSVTLKASVDGQPLTKTQGNNLDLKLQRVQSPVLTIAYPNNSVLGFAKGTGAPNVSDGYWLLLPPLPAGKHTIYFKGVITGGTFNGFVVEVTYNLTVS
jgi:hypothetical protein